MKKLALVSIVSVSIFFFAASAFAGSIAPGQSTSCKNAGSITLAVDGSSGPDRTNGNAVIWKSSNYTTVAVALGPGGNHGMQGERKVGMANKHSMGQKSVTFKGQNNFSRGDSIGDISGEVKITNTGTIPIAVTCG
jgi:spore coat protein U-like protein